MDGRRQDTHTQPSDESSRFHNVFEHVGDHTVHVRVGKAIEYLLAAARQTKKSGAPFQVHRLAFTGNTRLRSGRLLAVQFQARVDQTDNFIDGVVLHVLLRGNGLHHAIDPFDVRRTGKQCASGG